MTDLTSKTIPLVLLVFAIGALAGCAYSAAAFATVGGVLFAQEMRGLCASCVGEASC